MSELAKIYAVVIGMTVLDIALLLVFVFHEWHYLCH